VQEISIVCTLLQDMYEINAAIILVSSYCLFV